MANIKINLSKLTEAVGISTASIAKLGSGDNITTDVLLRMCKTLDCILETIRNNGGEVCLMK
jgi:putative transcriptional regulator